MTDFRKKILRMKPVSNLRYPLVISLFAVLITDASRLWGQEDGVTESEAPAGLMGIIFSGGIVGAIMIFILLALSMTAAYLIFDHLMTIRQKDLMPPGLHVPLTRLTVTSRDRRFRIYPHPPAQSVDHQSCHIFSRVQTDADGRGDRTMERAAQTVLRQLILGQHVGGHAVILFHCARFGFKTGCVLRAVGQLRFTL